MSATPISSTASSAVPPGARPAMDALQGIEAIVSESAPPGSAFEIRHNRTDDGVASISLHLADHQEPLRFASVYVEAGSGRFYRTYETGWPGSANIRRQTHYFVDAHDAAAYLCFIIRVAEQ